MKRLTVQILMLIATPFLALDCVLNAVLGGSIKQTLSAEAWRQRDHKYAWVWCIFINKLFFWQENHCRGAAYQEDSNGGSIWKYWWSRFPK